MLKFVQDIEEIITKIIEIDDSKVKFLEHIFMNKDVI